jgi:apolipoprotein N-acyltransferase
MHCSLLYLSATLWILPLFFIPGPLQIDQIDQNTGTFLLIWGVHLLYGIGHLKLKKDSGSGSKQFLEEILLVLAGIGFLFTYIFAANANLDYVQWFIQSGGNLKLAPDSRTERMVALLRYGPLILAGTGTYVQNAARRKPDPWRLVFVLASAGITSLSFPSFVHLDGFGLLAWIGLVPLLSVLYRTNWKTGVMYGTVYGVFTSTLINFWLGTFSLVSLQVVILIQGALYGMFMVFFTPLLKKVSREYRCIMTAALWTIFEYGRSSGFLGYPWGLLGASQYRFLPILQIASFTGVWGITFLVVLVNAALAELCTLERSTVKLQTAIYKGLQNRCCLNSLALPSRTVLFAFLLVFACTIYGGWVLQRNPVRNYTPLKGGAPGKSIGAAAAAGLSEDTAVIVLVQQNTDPRKDEYWKTFQVLRTLTDRALKDLPGDKPPDLIVWSETAFVPNIRRWSREDPNQYELARLVQGFLAYQKSLGTYLITGNDDYEIVDSQTEERKNYNAALFFAPDGTLLDVYHKNKLVPFTEYFPYQKEFPWVYDALLSFDVHFWEPGTEQTVFIHPRFRFSTPICFEDVFPNLVRGFVQKGADVIVNISNDYWSLTPVEGQQHAIHALLRAVENRKPLLRSTASGLTLQADPYGRILQTLPQYEEGYLIARVSLKDEGETLYTRYGDWFPRICGGIVFLVLGLSCNRGRRRFFRD